MSSSSVKGFLLRRQRKRSKSTTQEADLVHDDMEKRELDATTQDNSDGLQEKLKEEEVRVKEEPQATQFSQEEAMESACDVAAGLASDNDDTTSPPPPPFNLSPPNFSPASSAASSSDKQQQQLFHLERLLSQKDATIRQQSEELVATRLELQASRKQCQAHKQRAFDIQQKFLRWHKLLQDWMATSRTTAPPSGVVLLEGNNTSVDDKSNVEHRSNKRQRRTSRSKERKEKKHATDDNSSSTTTTHAKLPPPPVDEQRTSSATKKNQPLQRTLDSAETRSSLVQDSANSPLVTDARKHPQQHPQQSIRKRNDEKKQRAVESNEKRQSPQRTKQPTAKIPKDTLSAHRKPMDPPAAMQISQPSQRFDVYTAPRAQAKQPATSKSVSAIVAPPARTSEAPVQAKRNKPATKTSSSVSAIVAAERTSKSSAPVTRHKPMTNNKSSSVSDTVAPERTINASAQAKRKKPATKTPWDQKSSASIVDFSDAKKQNESNSHDVQTKKGSASSRSRLNEKLGGQQKMPVTSNKENIHPNKNKAEARRVTMTPVRQAASPSSQSSSSTEVEETQTTQLDPRASIWCLPTTASPPASSRAKPTTFSDRREPNEVSKKQREKQQHDSLHNATSQALLVEKEEEAITTSTVTKKPKSYSVAKALNGWRSTILAKSFVDEALDAAQVAAAAKKKKADEENSKRRPLVQNPYKKAKPSSGVTETRDTVMAKPSEKKGAPKVESSKIASTWKTKKRRKSFAFDDADDDSQESPSQTNKTADFKYQEVVRGKKQRQNLNGYSCAECGEFWETMVNGNEDIYNRKQFQNCSRHRAAFSPHNTPPGFWEMSFADEIRAREEEKQRKEMESIRHRLLVSEESQQAGPTREEEEKVCI